MGFGVFVYREKLLWVRVLDSTCGDLVSCVVMTCCSCDCYYGGVCNARGVCCCSGYADSVVPLLLFHAALSLVTASAIAITMVCVTSVIQEAWPKP